MSIKSSNTDIPQENWDRIFGAKIIEFKWSKEKLERLKRLKKRIKKHLEEGGE